MKSEGAPIQAEDVLANPVILRGAWLRVNSWYGRGDLAPQPELSQWQLYPEAELRELASQLRSGSWKPEPWRQVPYPKKGARLRHYLMPAVRDQVAFMAHMVALGPILDHQIADFAFGNRWHRPIAWHYQRLRPPGWVYRPYPVLSNRIYLPYARAHGLFRRAAHWTVARMTNATLPGAADSGRAQHPEDYPDESLRKWTKAAWWKGSRVESRAYWAALDIELAFPSVQLDRLGQAMDRALEHHEDVGYLFDACPGPVLEALGSVRVRVELGRRLMRALNQVEVDSRSIPRDAWAKPEVHPLPRIQDEPYKGIPTGLAISGMLLNVALLEADREIARYLDRTSGNERGARSAPTRAVRSRSTGWFALGSRRVASPARSKEICARSGRRSASSSIGPRGSSCSGVPWSGPQRGARSVSRRTPQPSTRRRHRG